MGIDGVRAKADRARSWRRRRAALVLACLVVLGLIAVPFVRDRMHQPAYPKAVVPSGVTVVTSASAAPTGPFVGTPAEDYPVSAAGITLPAATVVTGFSAVDVQAALTTGPVGADRRSP